MIKNIRYSIQAMTDSIQAAEVNIAGVIVKIS